MTLPAWTTKLAAAAVIPLLIGMGAALSAPSGAVDETVVDLDGDYVPGEFGIDFAAVTGPVGSQSGKLPACADPDRKGNLRDCLK